ncbi:MAG TPA: 1,4-dihydroxy-6-naphthoate synthase [Longimicrobiaceae bacterium]|nr:1,4-dihydroxy-6-naphthoate synthase [Longimicrobiaceae bacterium]
MSLGFSPCPNDTFIFDALMHAKIDTGGLRFDERLEDVETLNQLALRGVLDVSKVSYGAAPYLLDTYKLLRSGGALGRGCGPLLVARPGTRLEDLQAGAIAIPGKLTTANLLLRLFDPSLPPGIERIYSEIMPAVARGEVAAGLIIHESRFTYPEHGLVRLMDLGEWWETETGLPIPLGAIMARRDLGDGVIRAVETAIRDSVAYAFQNPSASREYVRAHSQEMDEAVCRQHIDLYVNDFSLDIGDDGERAVEELLGRAKGAMVSTSGGSTDYSS